MEYKKRYVLCYESNGVLYPLAWSYKIKKITNYIQNTLKPSPELLDHFSYDSCDEVLDQIPFYDISQMQLASFGGITFTQAEWEIIDKDFDFYLENINRYLLMTNIFVNGLSTQAQNAWNLITQEIQNIDHSDLSLSIYGAYIVNHFLFEEIESDKDMHDRLEFLSNREAEKIEIERMKNYIAQDYT